MFENPHNYKKIVSCLGIIGYSEEEIKKRGLKSEKNLPLECLYIFPKEESSNLNPFIFQCSPIIITNFHVQNFLQ